MFTYCLVDYTCYAFGLYIIQKGGANLMILASAVSVPLSQIIFSIHPLLGSFAGDMYVAPETSRKSVVERERRSFDIFVLTQDTPPLRLGIGQIHWHFSSPSLVMVSISSSPERDVLLASVAATNTMSNVDRVMMATLSTSRSEPRYSPLIKS